ncbi:MAG: enoyl-CoA hydratase/isomerase family protein [Chloroflexi bacterium]|nr:enoyl-CoA hydratase/isomerase family protein [Chloroflexota bacterium]
MKNEAMSMGYNTLKLETDNAVARLTLNRPERANSMTMEMGRELAAAVGAIRADSNVRVVVLSGAGKHFCAGADMAEFERLHSSPPDEVEAAVRAFLEAIGEMYRLPIPVIARINGDAFGGGVGLALACDLRVMAMSARMGFAFSRVGLTGADAGVTYFLPRIVGPARAMEILLMGTVFDGEAAAQEGLVSRVAAPDELDRLTDELAAKLAAGPPIGIRFTKEGVIESLARSLTAEFDFEARAQTACMMSADHKEGVKAFMEKRAPVFVGK